MIIHFGKKSKPGRSRIQLVLLFSGKLPMKVDVFKIPQSAPDDLTGLMELIQTQVINPATIVAVMGKTEGNGCVNDFTRGFAVATLKQYLVEHIGEQLTNQIVFVMSGGTEGVLSPHLTVFTRQTTELSGSPHFGLAIGVYHTRPFTVAELGTLAMVEEVANGVQQAIASAGLIPDEVHLVQIKCPLLTAARNAASTSSITQDSYKSMAYSRGASALGVAVALGEIAMADLSNADICNNYEFYSAVASTSAGVELQNCEILVLGNSPHSYSDYTIGHSVMHHALDTQAVKEAIANATRTSSAMTVTKTDDEAIAPNIIVNVFAKAEADPTGKILGCRHTMLDDSDISHTRMARAVVGATVASVVQDPMIYVSGGAEHQGPPGGGPIAVICR